MNETAERIHALLTEAFHPHMLVIEDESWKHAGHAGVREHGGGHYHLRIGAAHFAGKSRLQCHRMINQALASLFPKYIHALSIHIDQAVK
ncbi:MAG: BolA family transcriptional regulator [Zetaproteobacteria bacterium CG12_big_fil_rev_8_21_14_0_65_54_13]|nr:MAG: BolA family transcriptional regulator [Zetaproteobacteria bacterium CG23_combo_of_CG06-09_8_20_14_all_54_7]PIW51240.1 MAG: BolA family transcriptional regulator [Zetaproteobacteria bacterium CG12_big_fil_rev_8_21_14_0_65_54_13]PIX53538.1 MAG: BolA family transcriptional regulator [Zetaproteobacteria bacterium CG_4_10_14_3_um_filter_54_28]PJA28348.1 MAG: BolA family transcriptional regulator [Zetaproteobacteria bacterium CG_4_9_14_3_um_filter_54_145]